MGNLKIIKMFSIEFFTRFFVCSTMSVFVIPREFDTLPIEGHNRMTLGRDHAYDGMATIGEQYIVTIFQGINFSTCVRNCLSHSPDCAALFYSKTLLHCALLKCHINDKLKKDSTKGDDWEYWENSQGNVRFFYFLPMFYAPLRIFHIELYM
jgi:hypothetical protein